MKQPSSKSSTGNRTGVLVAPELAQELVEGAEMFSPAPNLDQSEAAAVRATYIEDGQSIGSEPEAQDRATGMFLDKLGARLAFERSGVRLYDALIQKRTSAGDGHPTVSDLKHIRNEELGHMHLLERYIYELGGDPTAMTPAADVTATMTSGVLKVAIDPRTTISQCLEAILTAELVDNDCWQVLVQMAHELGLKDEETELRQALAEEQEHLENVRKWILADSLQTT